MAGGPPALPRMVFEARTNAKGQDVLSVRADKLRTALERRLSQLKIEAECIDGVMVYNRPTVRLEYSLDFRHFKLVLRRWEERGVPMLCDALKVALAVFTVLLPEELRWFSVRRGWQGDGCNSAISLADRLDEFLRVFWVISRNKSDTHRANALQRYNHLMGTFEGVIAVTEFAIEHVRAKIVRGPAWLDEPDDEFDAVATDPLIPCHVPPSSSDGQMEGGDQDDGEFDHDTVDQPREELMGNTDESGNAAIIELVGQAASLPPFDISKLPPEDPRRRFPRRCRVPSCAEVSDGDISMDEPESFALQPDEASHG